MNDYTAVITVTDAADLTATINVTVKAIMQPFTDAEIAKIKGLSESTVWADCKDPSDGNTPYYYSWKDYGYGDFMNSVEGTTRTIGWWYKTNYADYGGIKITCPENAAIDAEVSGTLYFQYSNISWYDLYSYPGTAKVLEKTDTRTVVICWQLDQQNQRYNRGYVVVFNADLED